MRCVACLCCSTACPAQCIHIDAGEYPVGDKRRGYERYPVTFVIDELRCIFCGYCVEACPCDAIRMDTGMHAVPYDSREQFIYDRDLLLSFEGRDGTHETREPPPRAGRADVPRGDARARLALKVAAPIGELTACRSRRCAGRRSSAAAVATYRRGENGGAARGSRVDPRPRLSVASARREGPG